MEKSFLDKFLFAIAPQYALRRLRSRYAYEYMSQRLYEGAASGRRTQGWNALSTSQNAENQASLGKLRDRARDLVRNQPFASRGLQVIVSNTIGYGIRAQIKSASGRGLEPLKQAWKQWAETTQCDYDNRLDYYGIQSLVMRTVAESGECLIVRKRVSSGQQIIPFKLQILEPDYIDTLRDDQETTQGIKFDDSGKRVGYWLWNNHPGDTSGFFKQRSFQSSLVSADDILHVFRVDRPGQMRGPSWYSNSIGVLHELDEYMDASLMKQKVAASFAAFVQDIESTTDIVNNPPLSEKLEPGIIEILPPGKTVTFANPPTVSEFDPFTRAILRQISSGLGITYESLSGDYSQVNFSSGRMGWIEFQRNIDSWRWNMFVPQVCDPISRWFFEGAELRGIKLNGAYMVHTPPSRELIDPTSEINSSISAIRAGIKTLPEAIREMGFDPETHLQEIADSNKLLDSLGLILDTDPRKIMKSSGSFQPSQETQSVAQ